VSGRFSRPRMSPLALLRSSMVVVQAVLLYGSKTSWFFQRLPLASLESRGVPHPCSLSDGEEA